MHACPQGGDALIEGCNISSSSGTGIGSEGAFPTIRDCIVSGCVGHGLALFGGLEEDALGGGSIQVGDRLRCCVC